MPRPTVDFPQWNTDGTNRSVPSAGLVATGFAPNAVPSSSEENHRQHYIGTWGDHFQAELAAVSGNDQFADGGATDNTLLQALLSIGAWVFGRGTDGALVVGSGTTTMTEDREYTTITVESGGILETAGYRLWASQRITVEAGGTIRNNGQDAPSDSVGGAGGLGATLAGGADGADSGSPGGSSSNSLGGAGADGSDTIGGIVVFPGSIGRPGRLGFTHHRHDSTGGSLADAIRGGAGGGAGGTGAGGGGGGLIVITTPILEMEDATSVIQANGGSPTTQGGGGGGGVIFLSRRIQIGTGTIEALGILGAGDGQVLTFQV